ncbi:hypothetical protein [Streptomyces sp. NPDC018031]|uniref:hypothetical protein n=1 Tax=Streptomyces sp. NPDC018031 TaxID=3365033 RepID=UPI0037B3251F
MTMPTPETAAEPDDQAEDLQPGAEETDPAEVQPDDADPDGADQLGDAGTRALRSMKDKWRTERDRRKDLERQLAERADPADGDEPDADAIRRQAVQEATAAANARIVRAEIKAAAAGKLADPADALRYLDPGQFDVGDDGEVDAEEVAEAIADLLKSKPYLAAQGGRPRFHGTADSGARKGTGRPSQLTEDDLKRLSAAGRHAEIVQARNEGRLDDVLGLNR